MSDKKENFILNRYRSIERSAIKQYDKVADKHPKDRKTWVVLLNATMKYPQIGIHLLDGTDYTEFIMKIAKS